MSNRELCASLLDSFTDDQLVNVAAMLQAMKKAIEDAVSPDTPNATTQASMNEILEMVRTGSGEPFTGSTADLFASILTEED